MLLLQLVLLLLLLVILLLLIFFMVSTTFSTESQLRLRLPSSDRSSEPLTEKQQLLVDISQFGQYAIRRPTANSSRTYGSDDAEVFSELLKVTAGEWEEPVIVIRADRRSSHESVMLALDAARRAGFLNVTFSLQSQPEQ